MSLGITKLNYEHEEHAQTSLSPICYIASSASVIVQSIGCAISVNRHHQIFGHTENAQTSLSALCHSARFCFTSVEALAQLFSWHADKDGFIIRQLLHHMQTGFSAVCHNFLPDLRKCLNVICGLTWAGCVSCEQNLHSYAAHVVMSAIDPH